MLERLPLAASRPWVGYAAASALTLFSWWLRHQIGDGLPTGFPYLTFFPAVILSAFLFGWRAGTLSAVSSGLAAWYFFIPPIHSFELTVASSVALGFFVFIVTVDIALVHWMQRANAELCEERQRSLALASNRELLFQELQHRVGNNLQMVGGLLAMQKRRLTDVTARHALDEAARRLGVIGRLQRQLYDPAGKQLSLAPYIDTICRDVIEASGRDTVGYSFTASSDATLTPEMAIPTALVVAEALNNALEHGFGPEGSGSVAVSVEPTSSAVVVDILDDGRGLPSGFDIRLPIAWVLKSHALWRSPLAANSLWLPRPLAAARWPGSRLVPHRRTCELHP